MIADISAGWVALGGTVLGAVGVGIGTAVVHLLQNRGDRIQGDVQDMRTLSGFLFDEPADPRTRRPAKKGWTTQVDEKIDSHTEKIDIIGTQVGVIGESVERILAEVLPDGNGGHNMRGETARADRASKAALDAATTAAERAADAARKAEQAAKANGGTS